ncbi:F18 fimbrial protein FedE [Escherichia coli]|uniref:F18 fimbrial protein FedE n=1 Tax=Escherichia coli TaxID=562 RepID=UPI0011C75DE6|nr:F18 fimbrial protein FedE [Escherichia coli]MBS9139674.1 F18 fimbrial protein FedE [Escherichia coli]TXO63050.1 F18 fimbrial protein FedE [Escherichia coli]
MKFTKAALTVLIMMISGSVYSSDNYNLHLLIQATFTKPTCNISVPGTYEFGKLIQGEGEKRAADLDITWTCDVKKMTALTATVLNGNLIDDEQVMLVTDDKNKSNVLLSLVEKGKGNRIKLNVSSEEGYFCRDATATTSMRSCKLTPIITVPADAILGGVQATLLFSVAYL